MKTFYIDLTGDLVLDGQNNLKMVEGTDEIVQSIRLTVTTNINEFFLNPTFGFDRFSTLGSKKNNTDEIQEALIEAILQDERLESVESIDFTFIDRKVTVNFVVKTKDDETIEGVIGI